MIATLVSSLLIALQGATIDNSLVDLWRLTNRDYVRLDQRDTEGMADLTMHRKADLSSASIFLKRIGASKVQERIKDPLPNASLPWTEGSNGGFNGLPAGEFALHIVPVNGQGDSYFHAYAHDLAIQALLGYSATCQGGVLEFGGKDQDADREALEGTVRSALARALGQDLTDGGTAQLNHRSFPVKKLPGGKKFIQIDDWSSAFGTSLTVNRIRRTAAFTYGGKQQVAPLSANQVKVGSEWVALGDYIRAIGDLWFVPLDAWDGAIR